MRSGAISPTNNSTFGYADIIGWNWAHVAMTWGSVIYGDGTTSAAENIRFTIAIGVSVNPSNGPSSRFTGFPLRCLSTAGEGEESSD